MEFGLGARPCAKVSNSEKLGVFFTNDRRNSSKDIPIKPGYQAILFWFCGGIKQRISENERKFEKFSKILLRKMHFSAQFQTLRIRITWHNGTCPKTTWPNAKWPKSSLNLTLWGWRGYIWPLKKDGCIKSPTLSSAKFWRNLLRHIPPVISVEGQETTPVLYRST